MMVLTGLQTLAHPEDRGLANIQVEVNGSVYDWQIYIPGDITSLSSYLASVEQKTIDEILAKEAEWEALDPKTREITDVISGDVITVDIDKSEIVRPSVPDYYALRRGEYPAIGDQLDAIWKGADSPEFAVILQKIQEVKQKYPKP